MRLTCIAFSLVVGVLSTAQEAVELHLSTSDSGYMTVIQGFAAELQCTLNTCIKDPTKVHWLKDGLLIYNGTGLHAESGIDASNVLLKHLVAFDPNKDCSGECSDESPCGDGAHCLQNQCCPCLSEEFTLVLKNLSFTDAARYRCELDQGAQQLEFQLEVLESGLKPGFHENLTYDHSACCEEKGITQQCKAMCKPSDMEEHHFDPTSCKNTDYQSFLGCVTEGGNRSHVHCCKVQLVPPFCFDFCSGNFETLRRSHRLCLYYLPEILECYERAYLPFPDPPAEPTVVALKSDTIRVCWKPPPPQSSNAHLDINHYTVHYKQIPSFPFLGGDDGIPLLTGDQDYEHVEEQEEEYVENAGKLEPFLTISPDTLSSITPSPRLTKRDSEDEDIVVQLAEGVTGRLRRKRQTWVFVTHNTLTNDSQYREFKFEEVNTTDTCYTISNLRSATRYIVYVTATNDHGTSLPSTRSIAGTPPVLIPSNTTLPNIDGCCGENNVSSYCRTKMCDLKNPPSSFGAMAISTACRTEFTKVSPCLADGRNHTECCQLKGVQHDCLKICDGRPEPLGLQSLLCLNLDLNAVYECLREGYVSHPSPPQNVTITDVSATTARLIWSPPDSNAEKVQSYSIFVRKDEHGEPFQEIKHATSPHLLLDLEGDYPYMVYVVAYTENGKSLPSTIEEFYTRAASALDVCPFGQPLFHPNGHRYFCGMGIRQCPNGYDCIVSGSETETYCCQTAPSIEPIPTTEKFKKCCDEKGMSTECLSLCNYNTSLDTALQLSEQCMKHANVWVECGTDGRNHRPCCVEVGVPDICLSACSAPLVPLTEEHADCIQHVEKIMKCTVAGIEMLPGPAQRFELTALNDTVVTFAWDAPLQTTEVGHYQVRLFEGGAVVTEKNVTGTTVSFNVEPSRKYVTNAVTWNSHGSSIPTTNVTFDTPSVGSAESSPGKPSPPHSLHTVWNHGSSLNVTWSFSGLTVDGHIVAKPSYKVQYGPVQPADRTTIARTELMHTEDMWAVLEGLTEDISYDIYVSAVDTSSGLESAASEILDVYMTPDSPGLLEPTLTIEPPLQSDAAYTDGQKVNIICNANGPDAKNINVEITIGQNIKSSDPGTGKATLPLTVSEKDANLAVVCAVTESNGRQNRIETRLRVQFGPEVHVEKSTIRAYKDMSMELVCLVRGYPQPTVTWSFHPTGNPDAVQPVTDPVERRNEIDHAFESVLLIENATGRAGTYVCSALSSTGTRRETSIEVQLNNLALPVTPHFILDCCRDHQVPEQCRAPCNYTLDSDLFKSTPECEQETPKLIYCAKDGIDHRDCCAARGVTKECLDFCDRSLDEPDEPKPKLNITQCSRWASIVVSCSLLSHAKLPNPPGIVHAQTVGPTALEVSWTKPKSSEEIDQYAVYYRPLKDTNGKYEMKMTKTDSIVLDGLKSGERYVLAVTSLNMFGFSQFSTLNEARVDPAFSRSSGGSSAAGAILTTLFIILLAALLILGVIYMTRSNRLPMFVQKMSARGRTPLTNDPAVAFENPGYGTEAQIRGLPGGSNGSASTPADEGAWQSAKLEPAGDGRESPDLVAVGNGHQRGMRYAKLS